MKNYLVSSMTVFITAALFSQNIQTAQVNFSNQSSRGNSWFAMNENNADDRVNEVQIKNPGRQLQTNKVTNISNERRNQQFQANNVSIVHINVAQTNTQIVQQRASSTPNRRNLNVPVNNTNPVNRQIQGIVNDDRNPVQAINDNNIDLSNENLLSGNEQNQMIQLQLENNANKTDFGLKLPELNANPLSNKNNVSTNVKTTDSESESSSIEITLPKINLTKPVKTEKASILKTSKESSKKQGGHSYYQQKNKNYTGKKIKIWLRKNFKVVKKIRMSVSCPTF